MVVRGGGVSLSARLHEEKKMSVARALSPQHTPKGTHFSSKRSVLKPREEEEG